MEEMKHYHLPSNSPQEYKIFSGQSFDTSPVPLESSLSLSVKRKKKQENKSMSRSTPEHRHQRCIQTMVFLMYQFLKHKIKPLLGMPYAPFQKSNFKIEQGKGKRINSL